MRIVCVVVLAAVRRPIICNNSTRDQWSLLLWLLVVVGVVVLVVVNVRERSGCFSWYKLLALNRSERSAFVGTQIERAEPNHRSHRSTRIKSYRMSNCTNDRACKSIQLALPVWNRNILESVHRRVSDNLCVLCLDSSMWCPTHARKHGSSISAEYHSKTFLRSCRMRLNVFQVMTSFMPVIQKLPREHLASEFGPGERAEMEANGTQLWQRQNK